MRCSRPAKRCAGRSPEAPGGAHNSNWRPRRSWSRSEEHTSELQSRLHLVCRLLLEKKKKKKKERKKEQKIINNNTKKRTSIPIKREQCETISCTTVTLVYSDSKLRRVYEVSSGMMI